MSKAIAIARSAAPRPEELARVAIVVGCAVALIAAGQVLPL